MLTKLVEIGLSGWIVALVIPLMGLAVGAYFFRRRKTTQTEIIAGGDVAGGDISVSNRGHVSKSPTSESSVTIQSKISAGGDVAGGDIDKNNR